MRSGTLTRRAFLKLASAYGAAALGGWQREMALPRVASAWPLPFPHRFLPDPEAVLDAWLLDVDLLLLPAYAAATLIRYGAVQPLDGPPGRAHDPEGAYTRPHTYAVLARLGRGAGQDWPDDLGRRRALWPADRRLVIGQALQARGRSPNEWHAGRLAEVRADLLAEKPHLHPNPLRALRARAADLAFGLVDLAQLPTLLEAGTASLPPQGSMLVEFDWVIPAGAQDPDASRACLDRYLTATPPSLPDVDLPLVPLMPLPELTRAQQAEIWAVLTAA